MAPETPATPQPTPSAGYMLSNAIDTIQQLSEDAAAGVCLRTFALHDRTGYIFNNGRHAEPSIEWIDNDLYERNHRFATLEGFLDYLNSAHCLDDKGIVFVGEKSATCRHKYPGLDRDASTLALQDSEEFAAFKACFEHKNQKSLWRFLHNQLFDCIDIALYQIVTSLRANEKADTQISIDTVGLINSTANRHVTIETIDPKTGSKSTEIPVEWLWNGRIFQGFEQRYDIVFTLDVQVAGPMIQIAFAPRKIDNTVTQARLDLVQEIKTKIPKQFTCHDGYFLDD